LGNVCADINPVFSRLLDDKSEARSSWSPNETFSRWIKRNFSAINLIWV
jgi:hypothetical protein